MKKANGIKKPATNQLQARFLRERVLVKSRELRSVVYKLGDERKEPARIRQARAMLKKWDDAEYNFKRNIQRDAAKKLETVVQKVEEQILFSPPEVALKAVQQFESLAVQQR